MVEIHKKQIEQSRENPEWQAMDFRFSLKCSIALSTIS